jgi:hypothetical protein
MYTDVLWQGQTLAAKQKLKLLPDHFHLDLYQKHAQNGAFLHLVKSKNIFQKRSRKWSKLKI